MFEILVETASGIAPVLWSVLLFCVTLPVLATLRRWFRVFRMAQRLPSPPAHPVLGHTADFASKEKFFDRAMKWCQQFPVFHKTQILFHPLILVHSPEAVQTILSRNKHAEKGFIYKGLRALLGEGLITSKGARWHAHRKLITPTFHFHVLESFLEVFVERSKELMERLKEREGTGAFDISPLEEIGIYRMIRPWLLADWIFRFTKKGREQVYYKNVIKERKEAIKQRKLEGIESTEDDCRLSATTFYSSQQIYVDIRLILSKKHHTIDTLFSYKNWSASLKSKSFNTGKKRRAIFMDLLIESSENGTLLTDEDIREEVNSFMFAGQNTTQLAITYCLYLIARTPEVQSRVVEELEGIFGDSDRDPTMADLREMHYLERCIKEALRLFPSVPVIARTLTEDQPMGKHVLPAGADVLILPYVLHRNPDQFPDPEKFNPDNFLPERVKNRHPYSYIPFSAGPRQKFAMLAEKTILSTILRRYVITSPQSREELIVVPNTVLVPKRGIKIELTSRHPVSSS
ncbi:hypothetical protein B566_EDAN016112 [Ephemera danica]|nr:hypothetical protein B566_EDAN016112 [Ephemera danica]